MKQIEEGYITDAYHSLSIEGYRVSPDLIKRVRRGNWNPDGLTPAEARVAIALLECATLQEVADQLQVGKATVHSHVKQIYTKLGVDSRARFVKLMLGLAGRTV